MITTELYEPLYQLARRTPAFFICLYVSAIYGLLTFFDEIFAPPVHWVPISMVSRVLIAAFLAFLAQRRYGQRASPISTPMPDER